MSPLLTQFLKRITAVALLLAVLLLVAPRVLTEMGFLGPSAQDRIDQAAAAIEAASGYGASDELESFRAARRELESAQALLAKGRERDARTVAQKASERAVVAQRDGLIRRDAERRKAAAIVEEADRGLGELESLYGRARKGLPKARAAELLSLMKTARQAGSGLILLYEKDDYAAVIAGQAKAFATLDAVREELRTAT